MQSIETVYRETRFRSRFEADVALLLDSMDLAWKYEPVSVLMDDGTHYWPDFWIDECRLWVEVRGYESEKGERQIREFARHLIRQTEPGARAPDYLVFRPYRTDFFDGYYGFARSHHPAYMLECGCGRKCFFSMHGFWRCRRCGNTGDPYGMGTVWQMVRVGGRVAVRSEWGEVLTLGDMARGQVDRPVERAAKSGGMVTAGDVLASLQRGGTGAGQALRRVDLNERIQTLDDAERAG